MAAWMRTSLLVGGFLLLLLGLPAFAQIHGVPASVSSFGFGGSRSMSPGVPASVTSLGPNGFHGGSHLFGNRAGFFPPNGIHQSGNSHLFGHHRRNRGAFFGGIPVYSVPYYYPDTYADDDPDDDPQPAAGPTVFERHGGGLMASAGAPPKARKDAEQAPASPKPEPEPVAAQPNTVLVFKDGHQSEVQNYAIIAGTLFDLSAGRSKKIQLADLDLPATRKANDDRGVDFQVPVKSE